jgi:SapC
MTRHVMLNNIAHKDLRVINRFGAEFGDNVGTVLTFPTEYADMQREYPIFFRQDPASGEYHSVAVLGFAKDENLFLENGNWNATYIPGVILRGPFLIGFQEQQIDGELRKEPVIHVDMDHPRISNTEGEHVFLPHGGNSPYLDHMSAVLRGINQGIEISKAMFAVFSAMDLIEPVKLDIRLSEAVSYSLTGLHTINRQKLAALDGQSLERLNRAGFLEGAFLVMASLANVKRLMSLKQRRHAPRSNGR